jgi:hypothetical protein
MIYVVRETQENMQKKAPSQSGDELAQGVVRLI